LTFNMSHWINPILAVGATLFFIRVGERLFRFDVAFLGMIAIAFTPFFLLNNASYFSHTTALFMIALFLYSFLRWKDHPERGLWATISALALGFGLGTRYLTMAAICGPFLLFELIEILSKRKYWSRTHTIFAVTTAIMLGLNLFYNYLITGGFFEAPNHYHHSWERLGFHSNHTALEALRDVVARFVFLMDWIPPILVVAYFFVLVRLRKYHHLSTPFKIGFIYLPFAYLFYYSWGGNQYGPRYYFEGLPFLAIAVVGMLESSWRNSSLRIRKFVIGVCLAAMIGNVYSLAKYSLFFNAASSQRKALYSVAEETVEKPAIVFIRGFLGDTLVMSQEDAVRNHPDLNSDIIYAHHLGTRNEELVSKHPERTAYLGWFDRQQKKPFLTLLESEVLV
jgi:4-amino-4-deoxy-L-arabinose transferase-like glycosyltransferase